MKNSRWVILLLLLSACGSETDIKPPKVEIVKPTVLEPIVLQKTPLFDAEQAYQFIQKQVDFGPRVPNTKTHKQCAKYLAKTLADFGLDTIVQRTIVTAFNGKPLSIQNIIGQYNSEAINRILLCAHWDSRPFADRDTKKQAMPIEAANDGGSGAGVLLEIARTISQSDLPPNIGFDIIFFDAEDYGQPNSIMTAPKQNTWCLGAQYWAKNKHRMGYSAKYGVLLDMVGATDAVFPKDGVSMAYAAQYVNQMWRVAKEMGYSNYFVDRRMQGQITDDHLYVNAIAGIPCLDVIHYDIDRSDFGSFHHTHKDNMDIIDKKTLTAVGETVLQMIYQEN
ncbi:MAG: M28 family peptidase [Flavobacteriales bacterium]|nr:M28 family peptidase [Flavobacteriales bacterium]